MTVLGDVGPWVEIICVTLALKFCERRVFFKFFSFEIVMHHGCVLHFPIKTTHTGTSREPFCLGNVRLNLPESTWSVSCYQSQWGQEGSIVIEDLQCIRHSPLFSVHYRTHHG